MYVFMYVFKDVHIYVGMYVCVWAVCTYICVWAVLFRIVTVEAAYRR
jgi:hypothetical protein